MAYFKRLKKEIKKEIRMVGFFNKRPVADFVTDGYCSLNEINNDWLKNEFSDYLNYDGFLQALWNLINRLPKIKEENQKTELNDVLKKIVENYTWSPYVFEDEEYFIYINEIPEYKSEKWNPFAFYIASIYSNDEAKKFEISKEQLFPFSRINEYMIYNPGAIFLGNIFNENNKKIIKKIKKMYCRPTRIESRI